MQDEIATPSLSQGDVGTPTARGWSAPQLKRLDFDGTQLITKQPSSSEINNSTFPLYDSPPIC